jgi:hypothetical protein
MELVKLEAHRQLRQQAPQGMAKKSAIPDRLRQQVRERAQGRCEYCLIHEADMY